MNLLGPACAYGTQNRITDQTAFVNKSSGSKNHLGVEEIIMVHHPLSSIIHLTQCPPESIIYVNWLNNFLKLHNGQKWPFYAFVTLRNEKIFQKNSKNLLLITPRNMLEMVSGGANKCQLTQQAKLQRSVT